MEDVHRHDPYHVEAPRYTQQIHECVSLLKRINADDYHENAYLEHDKRWGKTKYWSTPTEDGKYYRFNSSRPNANTPEEKAQERKEYRKLMFHVDYLEKQDVERLFKLIKKHYKGWWV